MSKGVFESYVIIARVTSLVAVRSEKSKCKVARNQKNSCSEGWAECPEDLQNVKGIFHLIVLLLYI